MGRKVLNINDGSEIFPPQRKRVKVSLDGMWQGRGRERESISSIQHLSPCRFVVDSSQMTSNKTNPRSLKLVLVSNQLKKLTQGLHTNSWMLCWINEKYVGIHQFPYFLWQGGGVRLSYLKIQTQIVCR